VSDVPQPNDLVALLSRKIVGQPDALQFIVPYVQMFQAGLNPPERPAGVFLLLGPTGTGKTRTVEALAETLHGDARKLLKIDCAEYQSDHEVAKLIGAPPGYVGHRETKPMLTSERLIEAVTPGCELAIVLFDEIEKAAPALTTLLLGVLDKGVMRLGDNTTVNFERALIFLTSNLGAREMMKEVQPDIGFTQAAAPPAIAERLEQIGLNAVRKRFSPEFVNRIDVVITYRPLDQDSLAAIVDHHIDELHRHVQTRLGDRSFDIEVTPAARSLLVEKGASQQYGARELRRTIHRLLTQPLAALVARGAVPSGARVMVDVSPNADALTVAVERPAATEAAPPEPRRVLVLDDNEMLVEWMAMVLKHAGVTPVTTTSAHEARKLAREGRVDLAFLDLLLADGDGLSVGLELLRLWPRLEVVLMTGMELSSDEAVLCERQRFQVLRKPFLDHDVVAILHSRLGRVAAVGQ
jgi:MoxR-like ATPase